MDVTNAIRVARMTDIGKLRERNEDAVASDLSTGFVIVADGMGGYNGGAAASEMAILVMVSELASLMGNQNVLRELVSTMLSQAVAKANRAIYEASQSNVDYTGMGTTFVAGVFHDNKVVVGHVGDSRMYRLRSGVLEQLTEDHSFLQEQINAGLMTEEEAKTSSEGHLVTRALGTDPEVELDLSEYEAEVSDIYLFCSDGLTDLVDDDEVLEILLDSGDNINLAANNLIKLANKHGGNDNISVIIAQVRESFAMKRSWLQRILG